MFLLNFSTNDSTPPKSGDIPAEEFENPNNSDVGILCRAIITTSESFLLANSRVSFETSQSLLILSSKITGVESKYFKKVSCYYC